MPRNTLYVLVWCTGAFFQRRYGFLGLPGVIGALADALSSERNLEAPEGEKSATAARFLVPIGDTGVTSAMGE